MLSKEFSQKWDIPKCFSDARSFLRGIINMRAPLENEELFVIEDKLLQEELKEKVIVDAFSLEEIEPHIVLWK
ncbi:hypothetical protein IJU97_00990 [bacterium]|nr:hypothetical protein [bacterium]